MTGQSADTSRLQVAKLMLPLPRRGRVARPRLIERLNDGLSRGATLSLVSAPAGFGKTTLIADWSAELGRPTAWLSLDEGDNSPALFVEYLAAALGAASERFADLRLPADPTDAVAGLANALAVGDPVLLVLDDTHTITDRDVHALLRMLVEHPLPSLHVVILTREDPPLPLPRLRSRGQITDVRERDLRFTSDEAARFLNETMALHLRGDMATALAARAEGWIAGLQLAAIALAERPDDTDAFIAEFAGSDRYIMDYLIEEVIERQPEDIRQFLIDTSLINRLCASLCDALTARKDSQAVLEQIDAANLFIVPLDNRREWFRYHWLFAEMLRTMLDEGRRAELSRRAAGWFEAHNFFDDALIYLEDFADTPEEAARVARLLGRSSAAQHLDEPLSVRELEVLALIAAGLSNQEIADKLIISVGTVKRHINNIYGKVGAASRTQAIAIARRQNLLVS